MGATPDQMRSEIERTRARLTGDVDRLVDRTSPRRMAERRVGRMRSALRGAKERVMGMPSEGAGRVRDAADTAREGAGQAAGTVKDGAQQVAGTVQEGAQQAAGAVRAAPHAAAVQARGNPAAAGLIAFGGGLLLASLLPTTPAERKAGRQVREHAGDAAGLAEPVKEAARGLAEEGKDAVRQSAGQVKDTAARAAGTTGREARDQAGHVTGGAS